MRFVCRFLVNSYMAIWVASGRRVIVVLLGVRVGDSDRIDLTSTRESVPGSVEV